MKKIIKFLIILLILLLIIFAVYYFFFLNKKETTISTPSQQGEIISSVPIGELIEYPETQASTRAVQDSQGLIYYALNTPEIKTIMVVDNKGTEYKRWSSEDEQNIEIAGINGEEVIFYWTDSTNPDCADMWNTNNIYYGISFGTISYSGAAGLLLEEDSELIDKIKQQCLL